MARLCSQTACSRPAAATMTYGYAARTAWLDELEAERTPAGYDLCADHADRLRVPQGWELSDRRLAEQPLFTRTNA